MKRFDTRLFVLLSALFLLAITFNGITATVKGIVFEDINHNLKMDKNEPGIPGVAVSNQANVVATGDDGRFSLPLTDEAVIFISKPAGYQVPVNEENLPQFYYIHQPKGSPVLKYPGVEPTGKIPKMLYFPLFRQAESDTFKTVIFSDPQGRDEKELGYIRDDVCAELVGTDAAFGITLGDIVYNDLSLYPEYNSIVSKIGIPFYNVPGNHDMNFDAADDAHALETFKRYFGPPYYSLNYGKVHFVVMDDVDYLGLSGDSIPSPKYQGKIGEKQLAWLQNDLKFVPEDRLIVLCMHIPFVATEGDNPAVKVMDRDSLFNELSERDSLLALAGHMHLIEHYYLGESYGWSGKSPLHQLTCAAVSGTWWEGPPDARGIPIADERDGTPNGYHIIRFEGNRFVEEFKPASLDSRFQMRINFPAGTVSQALADSSQINVNVFDADEKYTVTCVIDDNPQQSMTRQVMNDPWFVGLMERYPENYLSWIEPELTPHIWTVAFPQGIAAGVHKIVVTAAGPERKTFTGASIFEIK